jgi:hypothetical protein
MPAQHQKSLSVTQLQHIRLDSIERAWSAFAFLTIILTAQFFVFAGGYFMPSFDSSFSLEHRDFQRVVKVIIGSGALVVFVSLCILYRFPRAALVISIIFSVVFFAAEIIDRYDKHLILLASGVTPTLSLRVGYVVFFLMLVYLEYEFILGGWDVYKLACYGNRNSGGIDIDHVLSPDPNPTAKNFFLNVLGIPQICTYLPPPRRLVSYLLFFCLTIVFAFFVVNLWSAAFGLPVIYGYGLPSVPQVGLPVFILSQLLSTSAIVGVPLALVAGFRFAARKFTRLSLEQLISKDARPPILFLRSFRDDQVKLQKARYRLLRRMISVGEPRPTLDHILLEEGTRYGPVVAIGAPGGRAPFGAARHYVTTEDWKKVVAELSGRASSVVVTVDETEGVKWELDHLIKNHLGKTLFLLPPRLGESGKLVSLLPSLLSGHAQTSEMVSALSESLQRERNCCVGWFCRTEDSLVVLTTSRNSQLSFVLASRLFLRIRR